jgi:hypothetical protein
VGDDGSTSAPATAANQTAEAVLLGAVNETAPATDTASSGLNGRLQRIAQRITSVIALLAGGLPAALSSGGGVKVGVVDAVPAGTNLIGKVSSSEETSTIYNGTTALTPKFAPIVASASGDTAVVASVVSKKIRVLSYTIVSTDVNNVKFRSAANDKTGLLYLGANGGAAVAFSPVGHFETNAGEALNINLSIAAAVGGHLVYVEI